MPSPFAGLFTGNQAPQPSQAAPSSAKGTFAGLFTTPTATPAPAAASTPTPIAPLTPLAPVSMSGAPIAPVNAGSTATGAPSAIKIPTNIGTTPVSTTPESLTDKAGADMAKYAPGLTSALADLQTNPLNLGNSLKSIVETPYTDVMSASNAFNSTVKTFIDGLKSGAPATQDVSNGLNAATSFVGGSLTPITTWFNVANKLPIVGDISKLLFNVPFSALGDASGDTGVGALKMLPISDQAKQNLEPGIRAVSTLAGQILGGKYVAPDVMDMLIKHFGAEDAQTIVSKAQEVAQEAKDNPNSPAGKSVASPTPNAVSETAAEPKTEAPPVTESATPVGTENATPNVPAESAPAVPPVEGTGETKTSGLAQGVEAKAVEEKLTRGFSDLPEYKTVSMKDQAAKATDIVSKDYEQAKRIAMGHEAAPTGVLPESVFVAVENKALEDGDVNTLRDLATQSSLTSEATTMGQRIRTLAERDDASPVEAIKGLQADREAAATRKLGKGGNLDKAKGDIADEIKGEIRKTTPKAKDWSSFVKSISC